MPPPPPECAAAHPPGPLRRRPPLTGRSPRVWRWLPGPSPQRLWDLARSRFWILPSLFVVTSIGLAIGLVALDRALGPTRDAFLYPGPATGARTFLQAIVEAMITVTGTVFSVSVVALQLANGQFSSRVIPVYLRDLVVQATLGQFMATFVYTMVVLRSVGSFGGFVPRIAITVSFVFVVVSVAMFIVYISRISNMLRVAQIVSYVAGDARRLVHRRYPLMASDRPAWPTLPQEVSTVPARRAGVVVSINERRLVTLASEADCVMVLVPRVGDFVPAGGPLLRVHAEPASPDHRDDLDQLTVEALRAVAQDIERTMEQDLAFGLRQLVDIAEKALSPSLNDPTTATQCLDQLHDLLRSLAGRDLPDGRHTDDSGHLRLVVPQYTFADLLDVALSEIWWYGAEATQIRPRIEALLDDLVTAATPEHTTAIRAWRQRLARA